MTMTMTMMQRLAKPFAIGLSLLGIGPAAATEPGRVAMLFPGSINDQSWNAAGHAGLKRIEAQGYGIALSENVQAADHVAAMRDYARRGFTVVIGHSGRFLAAAERAAPEFPKVQFIVGSGAKGNGANLRSVEVNRAQFAYAIGVLSAHMSKSNVIGVVAGLEGLPTIVGHVGGFRLGVLSVKPNAKVKVIYIKNMEDAVAGKEAALSLISDGADVVSGILNAGHTGLVQAAKEKGVFVTGRSLKHTAAAPDQVLTNILDDWSAIYEAVGREWRTGKISGDFTLYGFDTRPVTGAVLGYDEKRMFHPSVPKEAAAAVAKAIEALATKTLVLNPTKEDARGGL